MMLISPKLNSKSKQNFSLFIAECKLERSSWRSYHTTHYVEQTKTFKACTQVFTKTVEVRKRLSNLKKFYSIINAFSNLQQLKQKSQKF